MELINAFYRAKFCGGCDAECNNCLKYERIKTHKEKVHKINHLRSIYGNELDYFLQLSERFESDFIVLDESFCMMRYHTPNNIIVMMLKPDRTIEHYTIKKSGE